MDGEGERTIISEHAEIAKLNMTTRRRRLIVLGATLLLAWIVDVIVIAESTLSIQDCERIKPGMTKAEVIEILGSNHVYIDPMAGFTYPLYWPCREGILTVRFDGYDRVAWTDTSLDGNRLNCLWR